MKYRFVVPLLRQPYPSLAFSAIETLDNMDLQNKSVFEWGSGASTGYWLSRGANVISVEHSQYYFDLVKKQHTTERFIYLFQPAENDQNFNQEDIDNPEKYYSSIYRGLSFEKYAKTIDKYPDNTFDIVLVDGRARASCLMHGWRKVKYGGIMILDDSYRKRYLSKTKNIYISNFDEVIYKSICPRYFYEDETTFFVKNETL
jgi:hypothetical protein